MGGGEPGAAEVDLGHDRHGVPRSPGTGRSAGSRAPGRCAGRRRRAVAQRPPQHVEDLVAGGQAVAEDAVVGRRSAGGDRGQGGRRGGRGDGGDGPVDAGAGRQGGGEHRAGPQLLPAESVDDQEDDLAGVLGDRRASSRGPSTGGGRARSRAGAPGWRCSRRRSRGARVRRCPSTERCRGWGRVRTSVPTVGEKPRTETRRCRPPTCGDRSRHLSGTAARPVTSGTGAWVVDRPASGRLGGCAGSGHVAAVGHLQAGPRVARGCRASRWSCAGGRCSTRHRGACVSSRPARGLSCDRPSRRP